MDGAAGAVATVEREVAKGAPGPAVAAAWRPPEIVGGFEQRIGSSVVEEFVAGHDASDVLRELIQNEFDAGGTKLDVAFGRSSLVVVGNGRAIDARGWSRLDVILGTGRVVGAEAGRSIRPKENGIGSKNFGLRSLFLFGNRIHVRSNGRMAVLDLPAMGTRQLKDPDSRGERGVSVHVPYRAEPFHFLPAFDAERERGALDRIEAELLATLVKLARPGTRQGIRAVRIVSERVGRELSWRQSAELLKSKVKGVSVQRRKGRLVRLDGAGGAPARQESFEELEFSRAVAIPEGHADVPFPAYYRAPAGALRVSVSVPVRRGRVDLSAVGKFYYPLQAPQGATGCAVSVSAPFKLDADRTRLLETDWNSWLASEAADLVAALLTGDWLDRFGADAFIALRKISPAAPETFAAKIEAHLREAACWPRRDFAATKELAKASSLVVPSDPALDSFMNESRYLDARLAGDVRVTEMALANGAGRFTLNSLVRLRCAGQDGTKLATKLSQGEANYHFTGYATSLADEGRQQHMASTLTALGRRLSNANRKDLKETASTLAADGGLKLATSLVRVERDFWDVCPEPLSSRLHPCLLGHAAIAGLCRPFVLDTWIVEAAGRAAGGAIADGERDALYRHLLSDGDKLGRKAMAAVRRSPVVKDQRGAWVSPADLVQLPREQARIFDAVLSAPAPPLAKRRDFLRRLRIRRKLVGEDLVRLGETIGDADAAARFEDLLGRQLALLTPRTVERLRDIAFLRSRTGALYRPADLHLPTAANLACLGSEARIVAGGNGALHRRLGCRETPSSETLLEVLQQYSLQEERPPRPEVLYPALTAALRNEKRSAGALAEQPLLWVDGAFRTPAETLVGARIPRWFRGAVPVYRGPDAIERAYEELGANGQPRDRHWVQFFRWFADRPSAVGEARPVLERKMLREAYQRRGALGLPDGLPDSVRCLLARDGTLHTIQELRSGLFLEDDYPPLGSALSAVTAKISFAEILEGSRAFFLTLGLVRLSEACGAPRIEAGPPCAPPSWHRPHHSDDLLDLLHRADFAVALRELAWSQHRQGAKFRVAKLADLSARLSRIRAITFVSRVARVYRVASTQAAVAAEAAAGDDAIAVVPARNMFELEQMLAHALAEIAGATRVNDARALSVAILPLLRCRTKAEMRAYLTRQGVNPPEWSNVPLDLDGADPQDETEARTEEIVRELVGGLATKPSSSDAAPHTSRAAEPRPQAQPGPAAAQPAPFSLPPLDDVSPNVAPTANAVAGPRVAPLGGGGGGGGRDWSPPTFADLERDRLVGERGEALVRRLELDRLRAAGHADPESQVVWTSKLDPGADHDIRSVAPDGRPLWIEVKSTTGVDGRFEWPRREFEKAMREGDHYELWRVYEAHTQAPTVKVFRNPASLLAASALRLELSSIRAFVENKSALPPQPEPSGGSEPD